MTLFQWSFKVVRSDSGVETGPSNVGLSPPTVSHTLCHFFFWGKCFILYGYMQPWMLGGLCSYGWKQYLFPCMSPSPWKRFTISLDMLLIDFRFLGIFIWWRYFWDFPILGKVTVFTLPGCKVRFLVTSPINAQSSPAERMRSAGFLGAEVGVFMVSTWFSRSYFHWRQRARVLYLCTCGTFGVSVDFWCAVWGFSSVSLGMIQSTRWCESLVAPHDWNYILPCGSTLWGGAGDAFGVASGVFTLGGGVTCGGGTMLNISASGFRAAVCLYPNVVSGVVGVGLIRVWMRSAAACVSASFDEIIGNVRVDGGNSVVWETIPLDVLGM